MRITFDLDPPNLSLRSKKCSDADILAIGAFCIMLLAQEKNVPVDDIVAHTLRICKTSLKQVKEDVDSSIIIS